MVHLIDMVNINQTRSYLSIKSQLLAKIRLWALQDAFRRSCNENLSEIRMRSSEGSVFMSSVWIMTAGYSCSAGVRCTAGILSMLRIVRSAGHVGMATSLIPSHRKIHNIISASWTQPERKKRDPTYLIINLIGLYWYIKLVGEPQRNVIFDQNQHFSLANES